MKYYVNKQARKNVFFKSISYKEFQNLNKEGEFQGGSEIYFADIRFEAKKCEELYFLTFCDAYRLQNKNLIHRYISVDEHHVYLLNGATP